MAKTRYFQLIAGKSNKFWHIQLDDDEHTVTYGRIGSQGSSRTKTFTDATTAKTDCEKLIKSKTGKGYNEVTAAVGKKHQTSASAGAAKSGTTAKKTAVKKSAKKVTAKKTAASKKTASKKKTAATKSNKKKAASEAVSNKAAALDSIPALLKALAKKARGGNLIEIKADLKRDKPKFTKPEIFSLAVKWDAYEIVEAMLDNGLDVNATITKLGTHRYYKNFCSRNVKITQLLIDRGLKPKTVSNFWLSITAGYGPVGVLELLLDLGAKYNEKDRSLLGVAIEEKKLDAVQMLLARGEKVDPPAKADCDSPLMSACDEGSLKIASLLIDAGADVNYTGKYGITPLHRVVHGKQPDRVKIAKLLIDRGADPDGGNKARRPLLLSAAASSSTAMVELLLKAGADINKKSVFGETALIAAAYANRGDMIPLLIRKGADIEACYDQQAGSEFGGKNALEMARHAKARKAIAALEAVGKKGGGKKITKQPEQLTVKQSWKRIEAWLKANDPERAKSLAKPATAKQISDAEKKMKVKLPSDVKQTYQIHNGQKYSSSLVMDDDHGSYYLLPLNEMVKEWKVWTELMDGGEFEGEQSAGEKGIRSDAWYNRKWIPILSNGGGDSLCVDLDPARGGKAGQIISMNHEEDSRALIASSLAELLSNLVADLEAGVVEYD